MLKMIFGAFILLFCSSLQAQEINDLLYSELKLEFENKGLDLEKAKLDFESYLIKEGYLNGSNGEDKIAFLKSIVETDRPDFLQIGGFLAMGFQFKLPMQPLAEIALKHRENQTVAFNKSAFASILRTVEEQELNDRGSATIISLILLDNISKEGYNDPFFNVLFYTVLANFSDLSYRNNDIILVTEKDYSDYFGSNDYRLPMVESRNSFVISTDQEGQLMARQSVLPDVSDVSEKVTEWYLMNRDLTKSEVVNKIKDPSWKGYNCPFYSHITLPELDLKIENCQRQYTAALRDGNEQFILNKKFELIQWLDKKKVLTLTREEALQEMHMDAQIKVVVDLDENGKLFYAIGNELQEGLLKLRNDASIALFDESYLDITERHNFFLNDFSKLRAVENQFRVQIFANPNQTASGPPPAYQVEEEK